MVNLLLGWGAQIHAKNSLGKSPFQLALASSPKMVSTLLTKDRIYASDDYGASPLTIAIRDRAPISMIRTIIAQGARIDTVDAEGRTPLRLAVDRNSWELAKLIADSGADPFIPAGDGKIPAELAMTKGSEGIRSLFSGRAIHAKDSSGNTILHYAAKSGNPEMIALLLELGANKSVKNIAAESPADIAVRWRHSENAAMLN
jgi:ankyrin repeat protein